MGIFFNIFFFLAGAALIYVAAYLKVKEKNKELVISINKLENDKKSVLARCIAEIEKTKKQHAIDFEEKKFQFTDKRQQFSKYFALLDTFHEKTSALCVDNVTPILKNLLSNDFVTRNKAFEKYSQNTEALVDALKLENARVKAEESNLRLIASEEIDNLLDKLNPAVESTLVASRKMLKTMEMSEFLSDQSIIKPYQKTLFSNGKVIQLMHKALKEQMKLELDEI